ncbi:MAG: hypothetical protein V3T71_02700 [Dehalococcoidia bacterium]
MQDTRVLVASEHAPVRRLLTELVRGEPGVAVAGEAGNHIEATALARQLEPDVMLLDFHLPYIIGLDSVRLSRISGLDAALAVIDEVPSVRVVLLTNLDAAVYRGKGIGRSITKHLSTQRGGVLTPFALRELCLEVIQVGAPIFANIELIERAPVVRRRRAQQVFYGTVASLVGAWMLAGTVLLMLLLIAITVR